VGDSILGGYLKDRLLFKMLHVSKEKPQMHLLKVDIPVAV